jgi:hypothetical protein
MEKKVCSKCGEEKSMSDFRIRNKKTNNRFNHCIVCEKLYREKYKESKKIYNKEYNLKNKESKKIYNKEYREKNKEKLSEYRVGYRIKNKEKLSEYNRQYEKNNKNRRSNFFKSKYKSAPLFKIRILIRSIIYGSIKRGGYKKNTRSNNILGCSYEEFKVYIESKFESWMSWDNFGLYNGDLNYGWDIDHIIPLSSAKTEEDVIRLNHYTNLQPLCSYTNRNIKRDRLDWSSE